MARKIAKIKGKMCRVDAEVAKTIGRKIVGLILESHVYPILFVFDNERRWGFHTVLVLKPIDFVFIDRNKKVSEVRTRVRPFSLNIRPRKPVKYVLELPEGMGSLFSIGEKLKF